MTARGGAIAVLLLALALPWLGGVAPAHAVEPDEILADPALEQRARDLSRTLRCLVCQNQSIDDSNAPLARDLRVLVRERLVAGDSNAEVIDFVTARYGDFVLLRPPLDAHTIALWAGPFLIMLVGAGITVAVLRHHRRAGALVGDLTANEHDRVRRLLEGVEPADASQGRSVNETEGGRR